MNDLILHRQWASRPADERFSTFDELEAAVAARRASSTAAIWRLDNLRLRAQPDGDIVAAGGQLYNGAQFSNWSFNQACRLVGAPADFVAGLPAPLAVDVLNHQVHRRQDDDRGEVQVLIQERPGELPLLRAATSERYSRAIWDFDVVRLVRKLTDGTPFRNPLAFKDGKFGGDVEPGGLFASDRDVFMAVWDEDNAIEVGDERLHRFALFWNSETGARAFGATLGLVRTICKNLILWGARDLVDIRLRHVGAIDEKIADEVPRILDALSLADPVREREVIGAAIRNQVAKNDEQAVTWLRDKGFTQRVARSAVGMANLEEGGAGSVWQIVQGVTAHARSGSRTDKRGFSSGPCHLDKNKPHGRCHG